MNEDSEKRRENLEFQSECLREVLEKYEYTAEGFLNDFLGFFIRFCKREDADETADWIERRFAEKEEHWSDKDLDYAFEMLSIVADYKVKVMELENVDDRIREGGLEGDE